jgi:hypothetical protein
MTGEPDDQMLLGLRKMEQRLERIEQQNSDILARMTALDVGMAALRRDQGTDAETTARILVAMDRVRDDIGRIKRRLDLAGDIPH